MLKPVLTEKTLNEVKKFNRYTFFVDSKKTKFEIKRDIQEVFNVNVRRVLTSNISGKKVKVGKKRLTLKKADMKKAVAYLPEKEKIAIFETEEKGKKGSV